MEMRKIKEARIKRGFSQTKVANEIGLSQPGYANIENGETKNIPLSVAVKISNFLGVGFNELFDIDGDSQMIEILNHEIEALKKRIKDLEEQLIEKKQIVDLLVDAGLIISTARSIRDKEEGYNAVKRDFNDLDALIKELEDQQSFDSNALEYVQNYIKKLKGT